MQVYRLDEETSSHRSIIVHNKRVFWLNFPKVHHKIFQFLTLTLEFYSSTNLIIQNLDKRKFWLRLDQGG